MSFVVLLLAIVVEKFSGLRQRLQRDGGWLRELHKLETSPRLGNKPWWVLFILIALSWIYVQFGDVPIIAGLFYGIKPAVTAIVFHATYRIGSRSLKNKFLWLIAEFCNELCCLISIYRNG